jgi:hypothetical protein
MTENPLSISTQIATPVQTALNSNSAISANDAPNAADFVDDEPYTIKCICDYNDDDGNTIYCETCDTWQHIECFYPGRVADASKAEFDHSCADCKPRPLDRRHATERQRSQRQNKAANDSDRKTKRPPSKSHKKKSKPSDLQLNGYHDHDDPKNGSPQDHHSHSKKTKGHHRSNQSISSQTKRSPPLNARPPSNAHPPSPANTPPDLPPHVQIHSYSDYFRSLYDDDETFQTSQTNSFASLPVTNSLSLWLHDPEKLREDAGVNDKADVFQNLVVPVDMLKWPELRVERKDVTINDENLHWRFLITPTHLSQSGRIGELNGVVGFQKDYCNDDMNKWQETAHPRPFVFFHPRLPLFIDTRQEGSTCRYVRRSCRANTVLETFIASGSEYHFWLISERPLSANEQITIPWDFRFPSHSRSRFLHLLNLGDDDGAPLDVADITDEEYEHLTAMIYQVLSDHGGCACDLGPDCAFARFHRNYYGRAHAQTNGAKLKKGRKPKQNHVSPTSTSHATNSRAASEGQQEQYEDDSRSVSGSVRSKPHSRDLTPLHSISETNGMPLELTDREKRKIAMVEDSFRKLDQGQPPRKKKRASDGATATSQPAPKPRQRSVASRTSNSQAASNSNGLKGRQYVDASTSRRQSGSPSSGVSPTAAIASPENPSSRRDSIPYRSRPTGTAPTPKTSYADSSTQTDTINNEWYSKPCKSPVPKRTIVPLSKRLLKNRHKIRQERESQPRLGVDDQSVRASPDASMDLDAPSHEERLNQESPTDARGRNASIASSTPSVDAPSADVNMVDAPAIIKPPPPPPWPNSSNTNGAGLNTASGQTSPGLRVQLPSTPSFSTPNLSGPVSGSATPSSAAGSIAQSPFGTVHFPTTLAAPAVNGVGQNPNPIKTTKKLSLSDYRARKKNLDTSDMNKSSAGTSPTAAAAVLKPLLSSVEEAKVSGVLEGSAIVDTPMVEKTTDPVTSVTGPGPTSGSPSKNDLPSEQPNGSL